MYEIIIKSLKFFQEANYAGWEDFFFPLRLSFGKSSWSFYISVCLVSLLCSLSLDSETEFLKICHLLVQLQVLAVPTVPSFSSCYQITANMRHRYFSKQKTENNLWVLHPTVLKRAGLLKSNSDESRFWICHLRTVWLPGTYLVSLSCEMTKSLPTSREKFWFWKN